MIYFQVNLVLFGRPTLPAGIFAGRKVKHFEAIDYPEAFQSEWEGTFYRYPYKKDSEIIEEPPVQGRFYCEVYINTDKRKKTALSLTYIIEEGGQKNYFGFGIWKTSENPNAILMPIVQPQDVPEQMKALEHILEESRASIAAMVESLIDDWGIQQALWVGRGNPIVEWPGFMNIDMDGEIANVIENVVPDMEGLHVQYREDRPSVTFYYTETGESYNVWIRVPYMDRLGGEYVFYTRNIVNPHDVYIIPRDLTFGEMEQLLE